MIETENAEYISEDKVPETISEETKPDSEENRPEATETTQPSSEENELSISIDGESIEEDKLQNTAPEWVKSVREKNRELKRQNRELQEKLSSVQGAKEHVSDPGKKPTLEECDYDSDKFVSEIENWIDKKRSYDSERKKALEEEKNSESAWKDRLSLYQSSKESLKVKDFEDSEEIVQELLSTTQRGIIIEGADNPAIVTYALGKNPKKLKELASITSPVKFAYAISRLEIQLKISNTKKAPSPEKVISGDSGTSGVLDSTIERLRNEAERSGDYTKLHLYKQSLRRNKK